MHLVLKNTIEEILKLKNIDNENYLKNLSFNFLPQKEGLIFTSALKDLKRIKNYLEIKDNLEEVTKWGLIYIALHNLYHQHHQKENIHLLELETTLPIFLEIENLLNEEEKRKLQLAYISLAINSLRIDHKNDYLISEKIVLGEGYFYGVFELGIWGWKFNKNNFDLTIKNLVEKLEKNEIEKLIEKYKNLTHDLLNFNNKK
ncbi:MAG: hypothetical protein C4348_01255 [Patescibacteria group bacterium]